MVEQLWDNYSEKDLSEYEDSEAIYKDYSNSLKRVTYVKAVESHITVRELELEDLEIFYSILSETFRKGFRVQDFSYFQQMKEAFQRK